MLTWELRHVGSFHFSHARFVGLVPVLCLCAQIYGAVLILRQVKARLSENSSKIKAVIASRLPSCCVCMRSKLKATSSKAQILPQKGAFASGNFVGLGPPGVGNGRGGGANAEAEAKASVREGWSVNGYV